MKTKVSSVLIEFFDVGRGDSWVELTQTRDGKSQKLEFRGIGLRNVIGIRDDIAGVLRVFTDEALHEIEENP